MIDLKSLGRRFTLFVFPRYPFVNVVTLLLLLAERATREKTPPFGAAVIYVNVGVLFACALGMSFNQGRRFSAIIHAIHLLVIATAVYVTNALHYREAVKTRMSIRMVGVAGFFLIYAHFMSSKPRSTTLRRIGEVLIGLYALIATYSVLQISEDREGFFKLIPFPQPMLFIYATLLGVIGLCYLPGLFVYDITVMLVILLTLITAAVDCRMSYWTKRRGMDYWNQVRLVVDNLSIICGCLMYLSCSHKKLPKINEDSDNKVD